MAHPRPLRYKLILGMGAMVGSIGFLFGCTLYGIQTYSSTVRINERKLCELQIASLIVESLREPETATATYEYERSIQLATESLAKFRVANAQTVIRRFGPDYGEQEAGLIAQLDDNLKQLHKAIKLTRTVTEESPALLSQKLEVRKAYETARHCAEHLRLAIYDDIQSEIRHSSHTIHQSMRVMYFATALVLALMVTLLYAFRAFWVFRVDVNDVSSSVPSNGVSGK